MFRQAGNETDNDRAKQIDQQCGDRKGAWKRNQAEQIPADRSKRSSGANRQTGLHIRSSLKIISFIIA